jgi:hypothetical protein
LRLCSGEKAHKKKSNIGPGWNTEGIDHIISTFGVLRFFAEIDESRDFGTQGGIIGSCLRFAAREGFKELCERFELTYDSARAFRERYMIAAIKGLMAQ